ncbi:hypothetical protein [Salipaludibacillus aurantiacus]|nr:hypothetical protein [Salipaludibacillus aurantiacus]
MRKAKAQQEQINELEKRIEHLNDMINVLARKVADLEGKSKGPTYLG